MKMIKVLTLVYTGLLLLGCEPFALLDTKTSPPKKSHTQTEKKVVSDMIRGVIKAQYFNQNKNSWHYRLKVIDIANENVTNFTFTYSKKLYDVGDLIYVIFNKNNKKQIQNLYLIKKKYENSIRHEQKSNSKHKRTKERKTPWIKPPKTEIIKLN